MRQFSRCLLFLSLCLPGLVRAQFPRIDSFSPGFGEPGTQVTINGFFSTSGSITTSVAFGSGGALAQFSILSSSTIMATVPNGAQTGPISITQSFTANSASQFSVAPRVDSFERQGNPDVVFAAIGDSVQVEGANFIFGQTTIKVGGTVASSVNVTAPSQLFFTVPTGAETGPLTVQTFAGLFTTTTNLIVSGSAVITGFTPTNGVGGTQVTINGGDFSGATAVRFNGVAVLFNVTSASQIIATAPTNAGNGLIVVTTPNGDATSFTPFDSVSLAPVITGFSPTSGKAGDPVVITGLNFLGVTNVSFNGTNAQFGITSDTQINAIVPANVTSGPITAANSNGVATSTGSFGIEPIITEFTPLAGTVGTLVTINGQNLSEVTNVTFAGTHAAFTRTGPDQIQALVPFGATNGPISVVAPSGTNVTAEVFTVTFGIPLIASFTPTNGLGGSEVIMSGVHFSGVTNVTFNGTNAASFGVTSDSQITAFVPANATTGPITVFGPAGTNVSTNLFYFPPHISAFAPFRAVAGTTVLITGTNLTGTTAVEFAGGEQLKIPAAFTIEHDRQITAIVPTNVVNGALTLTAPGGRFVTTTNFTILPRLDSYAPHFAPAGASVIVTGQNFERIANVRFNGLNANYTFVSSSNLTTIVPVAATTGPISLRASEGDIIAFTNDFVVTRPSDLSVSQLNLPAVALDNVTVDIVISLTNNGPSIATEVRLTNTLDSVFTIQSAASTMGTCSVSNRTVVCVIPAMTNHTAAVLTVKAVPVTAGSYQSIAGVVSREGDPNHSNNSSTLVIPVVREGDRLISIADIGGARVKLQWNFSSAGFSLQGAPALLSAGTPWLTITAGVHNVTQNFAIFQVFTNHTTQDNRFFRLFRE